MQLKKVTASAAGRAAANDNWRQGWREYLVPARAGHGLEISGEYYRSVKFPGMVFRRRQIEGGVPAELGAHVNIVADRHMARIQSCTFKNVRYSDAALRTVRNRSTFAAPCRGTTRYAQDETGKLIPDDVEGAQTVERVMIEVEPNCFLNEVSARALGFGGHPEASYWGESRPSDGRSFLVLLPEEEGEPKGWSSTKEERATARARAAEKAEEERKAMSKQLRRTKKRQSIGNPNCRPSENEDFPLLAVLRRDRRSDLIAAALAYRQLVALCEAEPLKGQAYDAVNGMAVERRRFLRDGVAEVDAAAADGFDGKSVPGGEIKYRSEIKRSKGAYELPAKRAVPATAAIDGDPIVGRTQSLHIKINEDTLADYIDKKPVLTNIRAALGGLQGPLEDAALGGRTMQRIGEDEGFSGSAASSVGKGLVYRGLAILDGFLGATKKYKPANDNYLIEIRKIA